MMALPLTLLGLCIALHTIWMEKDTRVYAGRFIHVLILDFWGKQTENHLRFMLYQGGLMIDEFLSVF